MAGHPRCGIHLEQERAAIVAQHQIGASSPPAVQSLAAVSTTYRGVGMPVASQMSFVRNLSMHNAEAITPLPVYGIPMVSRAPCTVPSSPYRPCRMRNTRV